MINKILLLLLCSCLLLASCGKHVKDVTKTVTKDKSHITTVDNSETETTRDLDTTLYGLPIQLRGLLNIHDTGKSQGDSILKKTIIDAKTGTKLKLKYNKNTGEVSAKVDKPADSFKAAIHENIKSKDSKTTNQQNNITTRQKNKKSERDGTAPNWTLVFIVTIVIIVVFAYFIVFKKK